MAPQSNESKPMYHKDEKALCFHGELLYEAKVLEVRRQDPKDKTSAHEYRVHYKGWKNTWDDWVPQDRLRKLTDDNRELAANLRRELAAASAPKVVPKSTTKSRRGQGSELGSGRGSEERTSSVPVTGARGSKRARDNDIEKVGGPIPRKRAHKQDPLSRENLANHSSSPSAWKFPDPFGFLSGSDQDTTDNTSLRSTKVSTAPSFQDPSSEQIGLGAALDHSIDDGAASHGHQVTQHSDEMDSGQVNGHGKYDKDSLAQFILPPRRAAVKASEAISGASSKRAPSTSSPVKPPAKKRKVVASKKAGKAGKPDKSSPDPPKSGRGDKEAAVATKSKRLQERGASTSSAASRRQSLGLRTVQNTSYDEDSAESDSEEEALSTPRRATSTTAKKNATPNAHDVKVKSSLTPAFAATTIPARGSGRSSRPAKPMAALETFEAILRSGRRFTPSEMLQRNFTADQILQLPAPVDAPEQISRAKASERPRQYWAPLIGGTTSDERRFIGEEVEAAASTKAKYRPQWVRARNAPLNMSQAAALAPATPPKKAAPEGSKADGDQEAASEKDDDDDDDEKAPEEEIPDARDFQESNVRSTMKEFRFLAREVLFNAPGELGFSVLPDEARNPTKYWSSEQEDNFYARPSIRVPIPDHLKNILVDDWENVTKSLLLLPLPSQAPANFIFDEYFNEEKMNRRLGSTEADILEEFVSGMKVYFEKAIGKLLLYKFERPQLAEVRKLWESGKYTEWEGKGPGDCYGAEFVARMLTNMAEVVAQTNMDPEQITRLKAELTKFSTWLSRNSGRFFCAKYEKPSNEYIEVAR